MSNEKVEELVQDTLTFGGKLVQTDETDFDAPPPPELWSSFQKRRPVEAVKIGEEFHVVTPSGVQECHKEDYLVRSEDGDMWGVAAEQFDRTHVKLDELGQPVANVTADTPAPPVVVPQEDVASEPQVERAALALAAENAPRGAFDFFLYSLAHVAEVEATLAHLEEAGKIKREKGTHGAPSRFWTRVTKPGKCDRCGYEAREVPPEGLPCPNCARSVIRPTEK